ncbi:MAG: hypothetical protein JWO55_867 [Candidatus Saccharibacteria bacterium]|jgi:hypothetical protein|nr:hypothetical protein [Candidatus Saccharibacteria bacterium]
MKIIKRSVLKNKKIHAILSILLLVTAMGVHSLTKQTAPSPSAPKAKASAMATESSDKKEEAVPQSSMTQADAVLPQPASSYPLHENITATVFWVGEGADGSNDFIHNRASAWMTDWVSAYGGIDNPENRCGYRPCAFTPNENPFYFALPFNDYDENGLKSDAQLQQIPWYTGIIPENTSIIKNRWIKVSNDKKVAYAQWEDVGPFGENDAYYVFGTDKPAERRAGLDLSPALADYLDVDGRGVVSWRFIDSNNVPKGEWTKIVTKSNLNFD